jgi:NLI interacting factor-like phosphatase
VQLSSKSQIFLLYTTCKYEHPTLSVKRTCVLKTKALLYPALVAIKQDATMWYGCGWVFHLGRTSTTCTAAACRFALPQQLQQLQQLPYSVAQPQQQQRQLRSRMMIARTETSMSHHQQSRARSTGSRYEAPHLPRSQRTLSSKPSLYYRALSSSSSTKQQQQQLWTMNGNTMSGRASMANTKQRQILPTINSTTTTASSSPMMMMKNGVPIPFHIKELNRMRNGMANDPNDRFLRAVSSSSSSATSTALSMTSTHTSNRRIDSDDDDAYSNDNNDNDNDNHTNSDPNRLIVVLDLDECLIHSHFLESSLDAAIYAHQWFQANQRYNQRNNIAAPDSWTSSPSASISSTFDSFRMELYLPKTSHVHVFLRPGIIPFLHEVTQSYDTYIYTAGLSVYANPILNQLSNLVLEYRSIIANMTDDTTTAADGSGSSSNVAKVPIYTPSNFTKPNPCIFRGRYYREHCIPDPNVANVYYKDLTQLHRHNMHCSIPSSTHKMVLIDNSPISLMRNPHNGILVDSFYGPYTVTPIPPPTTPTTKTAPKPQPQPPLFEAMSFPNVLQLLHTLSNVPDVRPVLAEKKKLWIQSTSSTNSVTGSQPQDPTNMTTSVSNNNTSRTNNTRSSTNNNSPPEQPTMGMTT